MGRAKAGRVCAALVLLCLATPAGAAPETPAPETPAPETPAPEAPAPGTPAAELRAVAALCDRAAAQAAAESGVPLAVLRAITRTETGRALDDGFLPWPWAVNMEGKGLWFDSREAAIAYAEKEFARGARSFDMGCFQVNYKWHGAHFPSLAAMMDPLESARYAAKYLGELQAVLGDWAQAAGRYHSGTPEYAARYRARYERLLASLPPMPPEAGETRLAALTPPRKEIPALTLVTLPATPGAVAITFRASAPGGLLTPGRPLFVPGPGPGTVPAPAPVAPTPDPA
jgi:hypothetical protein